jgi:uncharacterized protein (TIGR04222 family)
MVSPFDLRGPEFLVFYLVLGAWVLLGLYLARRWGQATDPPQVNLTDPYLIAFLRGGKNEVLRVATVSLIDRGLLEVSGTQVTSVRGQSAAELRIPIEKRLSNLTFLTTRCIATRASWLGWTSFPVSRRSGRRTPG